MKKMTSPKVGGEKCVRESLQKMDLCNLHNRRILILIM
jgi:hypothetical protein